MNDSGPSLTCATCGVEVLLDTAPDGPPAVMWFLDARGHVLERGTVGEGHLQLTGDVQLGQTPSTRYCAGPVLPATAAIDLRDPAEPHVEIVDLRADAVVTYRV